MTKSELMGHLAEKYLAQGHSRLAVKDVEQSVKVLVDAMTRALARGPRSRSSRSALLALAGISSALWS